MTPLLHSDTLRYAANRARVIAEAGDLGGALASLAQELDDTAARSPRSSEAQPVTAPAPAQPTRADLARALEREALVVRQAAERPGDLTTRVTLLIDAQMLESAAAGLRRSVAQAHVARRAP